jgi:hypothetical protein
VTSHMADHVIRVRNELTDAKKPSSVKSPRDRLKQKLNFWTKTFLGPGRGPNTWRVAAHFPAANRKCRPLEIGFQDFRNHVLCKITEAPNPTPKAVFDLLFELIQTFSNYSYIFSQKQTSAGFVSCLENN